MARSAVAESRTRVTVRRTVPVAIQAGVDSGDRVRVSGEGEVSVYLDGRAAPLSALPTAAFTAP